MVEKEKNHCKSEYEKIKITNRKLEQTLSEVFKKIEQITYGDNEETVTSAKEIFRFTYDLKYKQAMREYENKIEELNQKNNDLIQQYDLLSLKYENSD